MNDGRFKYLVIHAFGSSEFKEIAEHYIKVYSSESPQNEFETVKKLERIRFLRELIDTGEQYIQQSMEGKK